MMTVRTTPYHLAVQPPSIIRVVPVMSDAAGDARQPTAPATSIGCPTRCSAAIRSSTSALNSGSAKAGSVPGVAINVGAIVLTVVLDFPHSTARHLVRCEIPAFVIQYIGSVGIPPSPA